MSMQPPAVELDGAAILKNVRALEPLLREQADEIEKQRRLTPPVVDAMRDAGVFRMPMPTSWGGPQLGPVEQIEIVEALSRASASAGWCAMLGSDGGFHSAHFPEEIAHKLWPSIDSVTAGWLFPGGRLDPTDDGYVLNGRWVFASGSMHADVFVAGALVFDGDAPVIGPEGAPEWRVAVLPATDVDIIDTWHSTGLAGSGSHDYAIKNLHVPAEHTWLFGAPGRREGPLYSWPGLFLCNIMGVPLGVARDALDVAIPILADKVVLPERTKAKDDPRVRTAVARAEALLGSSRSYVFDVFGDFWETLQAGDALSHKQRAAVTGCYVHVFQSCKEAVQLLCDAVGSASIYRSCPLDRHLRDMITTGQHLLAQVKLYDVAGKLWFGEESGRPGL